MVMEMEGRSMSWREIEKVKRKNAWQRAQRREGVDE